MARIEKLLHTSEFNNPAVNFLRTARKKACSLIPYYLERWACRRIYRETKGLVAYGPFAGMQVTEEHIFGAPMAKLLGTYEKELHEMLYLARSIVTPVVFDVGGAEGYYGIGMARWDRVSMVTVWELLEKGRELIQDRAVANGVTEKLKIYSTCTESHLFDTLRGVPEGFLLMDVEGAELELLSPRVCNKLIKWQFVIESHDFVHSGCLDSLIERFPNHLLRVVKTEQRTPADFPLDIWLPARVKVQLMNEGRPGEMSWLVGTPKS